MIAFFKKLSNRAEVLENKKRLAPPLVGESSLPALSQPEQNLIVVQGTQDMRLSLAARIVTIAPNLPEDKYIRLYAYTVQTLGTMALDEVLKIRHVLERTLKDMACAPPKLAGTLARHAERSVSQVVLRLCASISDNDLQRILASYPDYKISRILQQYAQEMKEDSNTLQTQMPVNISIDTSELDYGFVQNIVSGAKRLREWQIPAAAHITLSYKIEQEIAAIVDASVHEILLKQGDFDDEMIEEIIVVFRRRLARIQTNQKSYETPAQRVERLMRDKKLDEEMIKDAIAFQDREFIFAALARILNVDTVFIKDIFSARSAKSIVAMCWKVGFSMRTALVLQREIGHVPAPRLIYPKEGSLYPFTSEELNWQLEFLGLKQR